MGGVFLLCASCSLRCTVVVVRFMVVVVAVLLAHARFAGEERLKPSCRALERVSSGGWVDGWMTDQSVPILTRIQAFQSQRTLRDASQCAVSRSVLLAAPPPRGTAMVGKTKRKTRKDYPACPPASAFGVGLCCVRFLYFRLSRLCVSTGLHSPTQASEPARIRRFSVTLLMIDPQHPKYADAT